MNKENMKLWSSVCETDIKYCKNTKLGGRTITAIDPQYQKQMATASFGPMGISWGIKNEKIEYHDISETKMAHYAAMLWFNYKDKTGEIPIHANIKVCYRTRKGDLFIDDDYAKKLQTDALTKGLSSLGFNADVFLGKFEDNRYISDRTIDSQANDIVTHDMITSFVEAIDNDDAVAAWLLDEDLMVKTGYNENNFDLYLACTKKISANYPTNKITAYKNKLTELVKHGQENAASQVSDLVEADDNDGFLEVWGGYSKQEKIKIWRHISTENQDKIKSIKHG